MRFDYSHSFVSVNRVFTTDSHSFDEMLDYGICKVTYRLDKTDYYLS